MVEYPVWLVPSIVTGTEMLGNADKSEIVQTPLDESYPGSDMGMSKSIVFGPGPVALDWAISPRSEPGPESSVLVTARVAISHRSSR